MRTIFWGIAVAAYLVVACATVGLIEKEDDEVNLAWLAVFWPVTLPVMLTIKAYQWAQDRKRDRL